MGETLQANGQPSIGNYRTIVISLTVDIDQTNVFVDKTTFMTISTNSSSAIDGLSEMSINWTLNFKFLKNFVTIQMWIFPTRLPILGSRTKCEFRAVIFTINIEFITNLSTSFIFEVENYLEHLVLSPSNCSFFVKANFTFETDSMRFNCRVVLTKIRCT